MKGLTEKQETILKNNLDELNEKLIPNTLFKKGQRLLFKTVDELGTIYEYFVDFQNKYCMKQTLSSVCIFKKEEIKSFKF